MKTLEQIKISPAQFTGLLITTVLPTALLFVPGFTVKLAGRDAWMTEIIATLYGIMVVMVLTSLGSRFPDKTLIQYANDILGKYLSKLVGLSYFLWFIGSTILIVRQFSDFIVLSYMPRTPKVVFITIILMLAAYAVRCGFEVIARMNQFVLLLTFLSIAGIIGFVIKDFHVEYLFPMLENGVKPVIRGALAPSGWRGEVLMLIFFIPYLNNYRQARAAAIKAVLILGAVMILDIIVCLGVFELQVGQYVFPVYYMAYYIGFAGFIERVEAVVLALWVTGDAVKVAIWYYCAIASITQLFGLKDYKRLVFPVGLIIGVYSLVAYDNSVEIAKYLMLEAPSGFFTQELLIPLVLLIVAVIRKKSSFQQKGGKPQ